MGSQPELLTIPNLGQEIEVLSSYDRSIQTRVSELELGMYPNGHTPESDLSRASTGGTETKKFLREYRWAMAVGCFPHNGVEDKTTLLAASEDALFAAAETYEPQTEPNFLIHFSRISSQVLSEVFGKPKRLPIKVHNFDQAVIQNHLRPLPPLAGSRKIEDLEAVQAENGRVAVIDEQGELQLAKITSLKALESPFEHSVDLSDEEIDIVQCHVDALSEQGYDWKSRIDGTRMMYKGGTPYALNLLAFGILSYEEIKHLPIEVNTGTVMVELGSLPYHILANVNDSCIIRQPEWEMIKSDPLYREEWLKDGSKRNEYDMLRLRSAIGEATTSKSDVFHTRSPETKRAIPQRSFYGTGVVNRGSMVA
jgi:hypothetical protein